MKALIIGLGSIARKHIPAMKQAGVDEIYALRSSLNGADFEDVKNIYSVDEVKEHDFDFFLISNVTSKHADTISDLLEYKKPLFIEKPLFGEINISNEQLVEKILKLNIPTYVACNLRFLDCLKEAKRLLKQVRVNEINIYSGSYLPNWRPNVDFRKSYSARKELGGGVHIDLIHELDYLYWLCGEPQKTSSHFTSKSSLNISAVDYANYLWEYKGFNASVILNYFRKDTKRTMEIVTDEGTFLVDLFKNKIYKDEEEIFTSQQKITETYNPQMDFFITEIINGNESFNRVDEAYKILELCLKD